MDAQSLIAALGGTGAVAKLLGVGPSAVSNWKAANAIPSKWYLDLAREAKARKIAISPGAFMTPKSHNAAE